MVAVGYTVGVGAQTGRSRDGTRQFSRYRRTNCEETRAENRRTAARAQTEFLGRGQVAKRFSQKSKNAGEIESRRLFYSRSGINHDRD